MKTTELSKKSDWQMALVNAITDTEELFELLELDNRWLPAAKAAADRFPLKVPRSFLKRIQRNNIHDPLLRQVLPLEEELVDLAGYSNDPLLEAQVNPIPGLLHKYFGRVLLTLTSTCSINCRFCFRREFPYEKNNPGSKGWQQALNYIAQNPTISEVILSGGDPLAVSDHLLTQLTQKLVTIPHVRRLRIHSRMPVILPERITPEFIKWISQCGLATILVLHCNHPQEINQDVHIALQQLAQEGVTLLNQSVLLKGINDEVETLVALSETLFAARVQPYYLHMPDKVRGTAHFDQDLTTARQLHRELNARLPGYLVPRLAYEQAGAPAKIILS